MIKNKNIGLVIDREIIIKSVLQNGTELAVPCKFISAEKDRLYLKYPDYKMDVAQYFYVSRCIDVTMNTINGIITYSALVLYEPKDKLIVVEYYPVSNDYFTQKRKVFRVNACKKVKITDKDIDYWAYTINISANGFKFVINRKLDENKIYSALLTLNKTEEPLKLEFSIKHISYNSQDNLYEIAGEFLNLEEKVIKKLTKFCFNLQVNMITNKNI